MILNEIINIQNVDKIKQLLKSNNFENIIYEHNDLGGVHVTAELSMIIITLHKASLNCGCIIFKLHSKHNSTFNDNDLPSIYNHNEAFELWLVERLGKAHKINFTQTCKLLSLKTVIRNKHRANIH